MRPGRFAMIAVLMLVGACGAEKERNPDLKVEPTMATATTSPAEPKPDKAALESAVRDYSAAFLDGDGATAYALLTERCQNRTPLSEFAAITEQAKVAYGPRKITSLTIDLNSEQARVTYAYETTVLNQTDEPWAFESGQWHNDDC